MFFNVPRVQGYKYKIFHGDPNDLYGSVIVQFAPQYHGNRFTIAEYENIWSDAWEITCRLLVETSKLSKNAGADFLIVEVPRKIQFEESIKEQVIKTYPEIKFDFTLPSKMVRTCARTNGLKYFELLPHFLRAIEKGNGPLFHRIIDNHWNARGHAIATKSLVDYLIANKLVP